MTLLWGTIGVILVIVWVLTIADILRRHLGRSRTAAWILLVLILPVLGSLAYAVWRPRTAGQAESDAGAEDAWREQHPGRLPRAQ